MKNKIFITLLVLSLSKSFNRFGYRNYKDEVRECKNSNGQWIESSCRFENENNFSN